MESMGALIKKELTSIFSSAAGLFFSLVYLLSCGLMLWFFPGSFNILDAGYASLENFFSLSAILFIILIPALTMRLIAEEKKSRTFELLRSRPPGICKVWFSKWTAVFSFIFVNVLFTTVYIYTIYILGNPVGSIDLPATFVSYISMLFLAGVFISVGLFASSLTKNQIVAFIIALLLNFILYFGFDLLSTLFQNGKVRVVVSSFGLSFHFNQLQRGVVEITDLLIVLFYFFLFQLLSLRILKQHKKEARKNLLIGTVFITAVFILMLISPVYRFDFTKDKRYTISDYSKNLMKEYAGTNTSPLKVNVYLDGNLNAGFQKLRNAAYNLLAELERYAGHNMEVSFINPAVIPQAKANIQEYMTQQNMPGILLNEVDRDGKLSSRMIYPYAQLILENDTLPIPLLKNIPGNTAEENLNTSAENLEFEFIDAIRILNRKEELHIAFIDGHGELSRALLYDAEEILAKYFFINRGEIINDVSVLDGFKVVIIAGPTEKFTEQEKYILDQYLMKGGRIFWLIDGAYLSRAELASNGQSPSLKNETGLDDMLFTYGIRIDPNLLQDSQSTKILITNNESPQPVTIPWYYSPLLLPSPGHPVTKDIADVKAQFSSSISIIRKPDISTDILLTTSRHSKIIEVPEMVTFNIEDIQNNPGYFNESFIPVAVTLSGQFSSAFANRMVPDSISLNGHATIHKSKPTKIIVTSCSDIIRNELAGHGNQTQVLPIGFDRESGRQYGNRDFIVNAVKWLAEDEEALQLRTKSRQLHLLNKQLIYENRNYYALLNTISPLVLMFIVISAVYTVRRIRYTR